MKVKLFNNPPSAQEIKTQTTQDRNVIRALQKRSIFDRDVRNAYVRVSRSISNTIYRFPNGTTGNFNNGTIGLPMTPLALPLEPMVLPMVPLVEP